MTRRPPGNTNARQRLAAALACALAATALTAWPRATRAQVADDLAVQASEAYKLKDRERLTTLSRAANAQGHALAEWVEYWELTNRLADAQPPELERFAARWRGSYVEDRLRNDWLLELGRRGDWETFRAEHPRFRMNDDREVDCYAALAQHLAGHDARESARSAWHAQRDGDEGCQAVGPALFEARLLTTADAWQMLYRSVEANRPRTARAAAELIGPAVASEVEALFRNPARSLKANRRPGAETADRLAVFALWRLAASDVDAAHLQLEQQIRRHLRAGDLANAWAGITRQAAFRQHAKAAEFAAAAWAAWDRAGHRSPDAWPPWSDETLAWLARAALRGDGREVQWSLLQRAIDTMSPAAQREPAWGYWRARAAQALAAPGAKGEAARARAALELNAIASPLHFYGQLATEDLGRTIVLPAAPPPPTDAEREAARTHPGFTRALRLLALGLRSEGVREWNFALRGFEERDLLAAAEWACVNEIWDRCISTSERTRGEIDLAQRYPLPLREALLERAREAGVDPSYVYGLIRQESRFIMDIRSHAGATGLMQLMPATARWTARKAGIAWQPELIRDRDTNLLLGTTYLKLVLDDFGGAQALGAAAYNAGPRRPRRWREGAVLEPAAWIETIPFNETRDYVKKVLANAVVYAARLGTGATSLKARLGGPIGPRDPDAPAEDGELP